MCTRFYKGLPLALAISILTLGNAVLATVGSERALAGDINRIKNLIPSKRVTQCLRVLQSRSLSKDDRQLLIAIFAQDAKNLSPLYGHSNLPIDEGEWTEILSEGLQNDPVNQDIVFALAHLLINSRQYTKALDVITPYHKVKPGHETTAWLEYCRAHTNLNIQPTHPQTEAPPVIDLHFCVITGNPDAQDKASIAQLKKEVDILNNTFVTLAGEPIVRFRFKSASLYNEIRNLGSPFVALGDSKEPYSSNGYAKLFNKCQHRRVRDPFAINFYVYDSYNPKYGFQDKTSHGKRNSNRPYVLIDWQRLNNNIQNPEPHEMGHAFGLYHVAVPGSISTTPTNIMCSAGLRFGSGGLRNLGFTEAQTAIIRYHAKRTLSRLNPKLPIFNALTKGVKSLGVENWRFTAIAPLKPDIVPLFWGDHKAYTGDPGWPQNSYPPVALACEYKKGRFVALGHDGLLIDPGANDNFTTNIINWLGNDYIYKKVIIYTHIGVWFRKKILTAKAKELLTSRHVEIIELGSKVTDEDLKQCDLFIIVRPTQIISRNEIRSLVSYVEQGGSLLITGMGWLWVAQHKSHDIELFPLNRLGEHLGFEYSSTSIGKTPPNNKESTRSCSPLSLQSPSARNPVEIMSFSLPEHSNDFITHSIARSKNRYHYVVEGKHIIVSMPSRFFQKCRKPTEFISQLDAVYELYADLTDGFKPFYGHKIMILNVDNLKFHMSSGNPILSRQDRIDYILTELEKSNYQNPSWGLMHEMGHDFIIGMKHYFVFGHGGNESWAEFFAYYACQKLGLEAKEPTWKETALAYHQSGERDFERIKNDKWLMIGFLHHILDQYGWDVYQKLFKRYAELIRQNKYLEFDDTQKKVDLFVRELSLAAGANFYPYFARWGFPVSRSVNKELQHLPQAKLFN